MERDEEETRMLESEYEVLYCVRDLIQLYARQQQALYGRVSRHLQELTEETENRISEIAEMLG